MRKKDDQYAKYEKYRKKHDGENGDKKKRSSIRIIVAVILMILLVSEGIQVYNGVRLRSEKAKLEKQLDGAKEQQKSLEKEKENLTTREYIEKIAREKLGLFYPDEYVLEED